jgi:hypothetical protein
MERGPSEWRRINVLYECNWMNVSMLQKIWKINKKEWHPATNPLTFCLVQPEEGVQPRKKSPWRRTVPPQGVS